MTTKMGLGKYFSFYGVLLVIVLGVFGCATSNGEQNATEAISQCVEHDKLNVHIHVEFYPVFNRLPQALPAGIGISENCMRPLHTHADDFVVHVESPTGVQFTVRDFLEVWGEDGPYWGLDVDNASVNGEPFCSPAPSIPDCDGEDPLGINLEDGIRLIIDFTSG